MLEDSESLPIPVPELRFMIEVELDIEPAQHIASATGQERKIIPIHGGSFRAAFEEGDLVEGRVLPGGGDWMVIRPDGCAEIDTRFCLQLPNGGSIYVQDKGRYFAHPEVMAALGKGEDVDPSQYYFRTNTTFETDSPRWSWLNKIVAVGAGARQGNTVKMNVYRVV